MKNITKFLIFLLLLRVASNNTEANYNNRKQKNNRLNYKNKKYRLAEEKIEAAKIAEKQIAEAKIIEEKIESAKITEAKKADLVVFSYNRPIQLYALLESINLYISGIEETHVIYRTTDTECEKAYQQIQATFPYVIFHKQGQNPHLDFKPLTLKAAFESQSKYIIFAVDDIIVKDFVDISKSILLLELTDAYGFYLRLGLNISWCYYQNIANPVPKINKIAKEIYKWQLKDGISDWEFPNTVDMTLYKKSEIESTLKILNYREPGELEGRWCCHNIIETRNKFALCYEESKIVNVPLNIVQTQWPYSRNMNISTKLLLDKFNQGLKIDISQFHKIKNISAHMEFVPTFIKR